MTKLIRIVSDGTSQGTRIFDGDGNDISRYFNGVSWRVGVRGVATATLTAPVVELEAAVEVAPVNDPRLVETPLVETTALGDECRRYAVAKVIFHVPQTVGEDTEI